MEIRASVKLLFVFLVKYWSRFGVQAFQSHIPLFHEVDCRRKHRFRTLSFQEQISHQEKENLTQNSTTSVNGDSQLLEVNFLYGSSAPLVYDEKLGRYVNLKRQNKKDSIESPTSSNYFRNLIQQRIIPQLKVSFLPAGVTDNYYSFMKWRIVQRFINANLHVFGTQSLLLGLGIKAKMNSKLGALSAAMNWVLKDALGKIVRMVWASKMGLRFDSDAKRWRFRSAFVYALGNGLEIATYIFPQMFLLWATLANCCKQISTLTSSSTRSSIFISFRDGSRENIADMTAKGEAQIAVVDLLGISSGIYLSRVVGMSVQKIVMVYFILQAMEIFCVYRQLVHVEYRVLNFERLTKVISHYISSQDALDSTEAIGNGDSNCILPSPHEIAKKENMFLPPAHLARRQISFGSLGRTKLSPDELNQLIDICKRERFLLVVGENVKRPSKFLSSLVKKTKSPRECIKEKCHIVLHSEATNTDIVKSTLALSLLRLKLEERAESSKEVRTSNCIDLIRDSINEADRLFGPLLRQMTKRGWESPAKFMFGRVNMRTDWPRPNSRTQ